MTQQVQELIDKIKFEGVEPAKKQAQEIENDAKLKADQIIKQAKEQADKILADAQQEAKKTEESTRMALKQASRDTILSLRKEIESILGKIISLQVSESLTADQMGSILTAVIQESLKDTKSEADITVAVNKNDLKKLEESVAAKLQKQLKGSVKFQASDDINKGFTVSYDDGKSCFDFTDESLAKYLGNFLNAQISSLTSEAVE